MGIRFNADEILAMVEQVERNGAKFYRKAAEQVSDGEMTATLNWLAEEEDKHEKMFADMRSQLKGEGQLPLTWDPAGEAEMYLQAMADGKVFDIREDPIRAAEQLATPRNILEFALDREKDSIVFYVAMQDMVSQELGKDRISGIVKEEIRHVTIISEKLASL